MYTYARVCLFGPCYSARVSATLPLVEERGNQRYTNAQSGDTRWNTNPRSPRDLLGSPDLIAPSVGPRNWMNPFRIPADLGPRFRSPEQVPRRRGVLAARRDAWVLARRRRSGGERPHASHADGVQRYRLPRGWAQPSSCRCSWTPLVPRPSACPAACFGARAKPPHSSSTARTCGVLFSDPASIMKDPASRAPETWED